MVAPVTRIRARRLAWGFAAVAALFVAASLPAAANDMGGPAAWAWAMFWFLAVPILLPIYTLAVAFLEAAVVNAFLKLGYWKCFRAVLLANVVSTLLGIVWMLALKEGGWKMAFTSPHSSMLGWLLARSFVVTVAEETLVVGLVLRRKCDLASVLNAVAAANVVSYALSALLLLPMVR